MESFDRSSEGKFDLMEYHTREPEQIDEEFGPGTYDAIRKEAGDSFAGLQKFAKDLGMKGTAMYTDVQIVAWIAHHRRS